MNKIVPVLYVICAMIMYSFQSIILDKKLSYMSPIVIACIFTIVQIVILFPILLAMKGFGMDLVMPNREHYGYVLICGLLMGFGALCFFMAYSCGGNFPMVTTVAALLPVFSLLLSVLFWGQIPSVRQVLGCLLAVVAVYLVVGEKTP